MKHSFRGKSYRVRFRQFAPHERDATGLCHWKDKLLEIDKRLCDRKLLSTLLHEGLHACLPDLNEDAIGETDESLSKFLWKLGWRETQGRKA